jgi:hypothetical protein
MRLWTGDRRSLRCPPRILFLFLSIWPEIESPLIKIHALVPSSTLNLSAATLTVTFLSDSVLETLPDRIAGAWSAEKGKGNQVTGSCVQRPAEGKTS